MYREHWTCGYEKSGWTFRIDTEDWRFSVGVRRDGYWIEFHVQILILYIDYSWWRGGKDKNR